ncbi:MAG: dTDP-4-dehydrorhamnose 3,5-epimerase [Chloroflexi bacterium]|nr:dTDP-4-dehydrorhamnose 3,5-epimerase [Chloroflexota bacterium]
MDIKPLRLQGCYEIRLTPRRDERGYFMRTFDREIFLRNGLTANWLQENQSMSLRKGTLRGLHFQKLPHAETKLVRALSGAVLDVFADLRSDSPTFGQWEAVELSAEAFNYVYIPKGFAHGFCSLTENAIVHYHVDACYAPEAEGGIRWDDETLKIDWPVKTPVVSAKDQALPRLAEFISPFTLSNCVVISQQEMAHVR